MCICRLDVYNLKEDAAAFACKRALISFLSWLDYCDQLIKEAQKVKTIQSKTRKLVNIESCSNCLYTNCKNI